MWKCLSGIALSLGLATAVFAAPVVTKIAIVHWNDMHGHALAFQHKGADNVSGLPAIATFLKQTRAEFNNHVLVLDAGDYNTGRPESDFFKAEPMIVGYNLMQVDAVALGNHEFDHPPSVLAQQKALATFPLISANIKNKEGKYVAKAPYVIKDINNIKVGVFGVTTPATPHITMPENSKDMHFLDDIQTAKEVVEELKNKAHCDVIIALTHLGIDDDNRTGSRALASQVSGIDLIVDGHSHTCLSAPIMEKNPDKKDVPIVQAYQWGLRVGKGALTLTDKKITSFEWQALTINDKKIVKNVDGTQKVTPVGPQFEEDPTVKAALSGYLTKVDAILDNKLGVFSEKPWTYGASREKETALGDLVSDAIKAAVPHAKPDFALCNGGGIRADLPKGDLTAKHIYICLPFDNTITVCTFKGSDLLSLFGFIASLPPESGGFPQVSDGVSFTINRPQKKCENILIHGKPLDPAKTYRVATHAFVSSGGDGYKVFKKATQVLDTAIWVRDACVTYLRTLGPKITPVLKKRIQVKP